MKAKHLVYLGAALSALSLAACGQKADKPVSFKADVMPILEKNCLECHKPGGEGFEKSGQDMSSHAGLMKGTKFGPTIKAGDSMTSALVMLVEGRADPSIKMPHSKEPLSPQQIEAIKKWVDQGAQNN